MIGGQRKMLFSGSIHYPRSTPEMWPSLISKAKEGGIDVIATYIFWNLHELQSGQYDFNGGRDVVGFIKEVQAQGLYVFLRIGPFIEAERSYGGLPVWLRDIPGIVFRSNNDPYKVYMQNFTTKIVTMLQSQNLFASQGGPIILAQVENEYGNVEEAYGEEGKSYLRWIAELVVGLNTGVPWVMCKQDDAPEPLINSCNGKKCGETFVGPNSPNKPSIWTENWTTRYQAFGEDAVVRSATDIAFHTLLFILAKNGSFINYYMYHGGTNFGRSASAFVTTNYYDQAPIDEYGMERQPKWGHLKELHAAVKSSAGPLLSGVQVNFPVGPNQWVYYEDGGTGQCAVAFLVNPEKHGTPVPVTFQNGSYVLPPKSISILPDCKNVVFNTATVSAQSNSRTMSRSKIFDRPELWEEYKEAVPRYDDTTSVRSQKLLDHISTTKDASDYLWYTFRYDNQRISNGGLLNVTSLGHALHVFVNGQRVGSAHGSHEKPGFNLVAQLPQGANNAGTTNVSLLSVTVGLQDSGAFLEKKAAGPIKVVIQDQNNVVHDFRKHPWGYQVGMVGEKLQVFTEQGAGQVQWRSFSNGFNPITWYKTVFDAPLEDAPIALNLGSMGKGEAWVNGQSIGRFWASYHTPKGSSQTWYHVPRSWIKPSGNLLVVLEEEGGNPLNVSLDTATPTSFSQLCTHVAAGVGSLDRVPSDKSRRTNTTGRLMKLKCPKKTRISKIAFASYGTPMGSCSGEKVSSEYLEGACHSKNSMATLEKVRYSSFYTLPF
ncbi:unnamed protein product [Linum tenue]|uniref:Beta-galactosidase n=1 Tax=Linum tenue TaxID=586396 RepID=A0AAV0RGI1_9ROSI|nr:unnamed protein product [Linum tenue]